MEGFRVLAQGNHRFIYKRCIYGLGLGISGYIVDTYLGVK